MQHSQEDLFYQQLYKQLKFQLLIHMIAIV